MKFTVEVRCLAPEWPVPSPVVIEDRRYFEAEVTKEVGGQIYRLNIVTEAFPKDDSYERRLALDKLFSSLTYSLRREQFAEDTFIYEEVKRDGKTLFYNPKYPVAK
jgi:hypothetical protein